jgi:fructose-bisphosphate aldolase class I
MTAPSFTGDKVIAAILFEGTMDGTVEGKQAPAYLWEQRGVVPFVKVDKGLEEEADSVRLMKPIPGLDALLERAAGLGIYGTKMRSVINGASRSGIAAIVQQQFEIGRQISGHGLMPIIEPEVSIKAPDKSAAEEILRDEIHAQLDKLAGGSKVMLKLTIPTVPDLFAPLISHAHVQRVVALSGGYTRQEACRLLAKSHGMIASFSRALINDLRASMSDAEFDAALGEAIDEIFQASVNKV